MGNVCVLFPLFPTIKDFFQTLFSCAFALGFESFCRLLSDPTANGFLEGIASFFGCLPRFLTNRTRKRQLLGQLG